MSRYDYKQKNVTLLYDIIINITLSDLMQAQTDLMRTTKRVMAGRIWPVGHQFDTPALNTHEWCRLQLLRKA